MSIICSSVITLNMPEGSSYDYDESKYTVTIYSLPHNMFNLDDGYHRYLAMSQICDFDSDFDYIMELRLVNFDPIKANQFIFQQDQKTPMKKIISDSYDSNSISNRVIQRLNIDPLFNLQGKLGRNNTLINSPLLGKLINYFYPKPKDKDENLWVIEVKRDLLTKFNALSDFDPKYMEEKYSDTLLTVVMYVFAQEDINAKEYVNAVRYLMDNISEEEAKQFTLTGAGRVRLSVINMLNGKLKDWR